ncbi:hypothetical protein [Asaia sp. HumB]|uniref:hypothetical protein n=1 Tax=Asaia sp. HumB TaxID=3035475 RepID=UPI00255510E1|nr:hypothetical protein [Asaia sp. HumB]MDL2172439.1 hypothetical protein [Asaia sp. HumB]
MPWFKIKIGSFGLGRHAGPPPSFRLTFLQVVWKDWDLFEAWALAEVDRYKRALEAARKELQK